MTPESLASTVETLQALDQRVDRAASQHDVQTLDFVLAEDFRYTHSTGASQTKQEWIDSLRPLAGQRQRLPSSPRVELHGEIAVVLGDLDIVWKERPRRYYRYVRIYRNEGGAWKVISQRTLPADDRAPAGGAS